MTRISAIASRTDCQSVHPSEILRHAQNDTHLPERTAMNRHFLVAAIIALLLAGSSSAQVVHQPFKPPVTAAKIRTAIDDAVTYLRSHQAANASILDQGDGCYTALA